MTQIKKRPLRQRTRKKWWRVSGTPLIVYLTVILGIVAALMIAPYHDELSLNLVSEIIGAAFIIFVIDVLLVRSKTGQWRVVQEQCEYQIARNVSRIRDGLTFRAFGFRPVIEKGGKNIDQQSNVRAQRDQRLEQLRQMPVDALAAEIKSNLFSQSNYEYFNEKADEIWNLLNMKHAEFLAPELVAMLMDLHSGLKDICAHIRIFNRAEHFPEERDYYERTGIHGAAHTLSDLVDVLVELKEEGYSEPARS